MDIMAQHVRKTNMEETIEPRTLLTDMPMTAPIVIHTGITTGDIYGYPRTMKNIPSIRERPPPAIGESQ